MYRIEPSLCLSTPLNLRLSLSTLAVWKSSICPSRYVQGKMRLHESKSQGLERARIHHHVLADRVRSEGYCSRSLCLSPLILALQAPNQMVLMLKYSFGDPPPPPPPPRPMLNIIRCSYNARCGQFLRTRTQDMQ